MFGPRSLSVHSKKRQLFPQLSLALLHIYVYADYLHIMMDLDRRRPSSLLFPSSLWLFTERKFSHGRAERRLSPKYPPADSRSPPPAQDRRLTAGWLSHWPAPSQPWSAHRGASHSPCHHLISLYATARRRSAGGPLHPPLQRACINRDGYKSPGSWPGGPSGPERCPVPYWGPGESPPGGKWQSSRLRPFPATGRVPW